ncbi:NAD-dependent epimerase/dehydratase family protein [Paenarthrobacter sp. NPDC092416]|uniref:NAD-dependent epimerase/dehydratase family protein n=1 Tax=Paenarthrobacter sp. NPDC092416 TaxID=3364386 RepID=UPI0037F1A682
MRILILGGTAFLSAETARHAVALGHDVTCLARGTSAEAPDGVTWIRADRSLGAAAFADAAGDWDAVVDVSRDPVQAKAALESLGSRAKHWTFVSSCSVYADHSVPGEDESAERLEPLPAGQAGTPGTYGESKSAIEQMTLAMVGDRAHIVRAGLIGGPGDGTDRYGYWPARFAANSGPVLVPDIPGAATQIIDVRDLAAWILWAAETGLTGTYNALGAVVPFGDYISESRRLAAEAAAGGEPIWAAEDWLVEQGVDYWAGPDSVPLWLPPGHEGFQARTNRAAREQGMTLRPWQETLRDTLEDEVTRGLERDRKAGLSRATESRLVAELSSQRAEQR